MRLEVKAKYDYNSGHEDDLTFRAGQIIQVFEEIDAEWFNGEYSDAQGNLQRGMFPRNYVSIIPPKKPDVIARPNIEQPASNSANRSGGSESIIEGESSTKRVPSNVGFEPPSRTSTDIPTSIDVMKAGGHSTIKGTPLVSQGVSGRHFH